MSIVCSANRPLHDAVLAEVDRGIERLASRARRR
jgi:hypothetical protein